jgi:hypothetical protein
MKLFVIRNSCGDPYLIRWTFFDVFGYSLKLHIILRSDDDRAPHDHPWDFLTLMLQGGYWEHTFSAVKGETNRTWVKPWTLRRCRAPHPHRLELVEEVPVARPTDPKLQNEIIDGFFSPNVRQMFRPAITLVFMWPSKREWGFYTPGRWVHWRDFLRDYTRHDC